MKALTSTLIVCTIILGILVKGNIERQGPSLRLLFSPMTTPSLLTGPSQSDCIGLKQFTSSADPRRYGWCRLEEALADDKKDGYSPWNTWSTKCFTAPDLTGKRTGTGQILLSRICLSPGLKSTTSTEVNSSFMTKRQGLDKSHLASIFYNPVATNSILKNGLSLPNPPRGPDAPPDPLQPVEGKVLAIPPFDSGSVVVKAIWEIVQQDASKNWPVAVYDPEFPANELNANGTPTGTLLQPSPLSGGVGWNTVVNLDVKNDQVCNDSSGKAIGTIILTRGTPTIPLGCFHFAKVPAKSPEGSFVRTITTDGVSTTGDYYLLLVGMHIAKKEGNQWTWTTFWWTNRPDYNGGLDFKEQPTDLPAAYGHFAMNTTVSGQAVVYNPYLEGTQGPNGTMSNCAHCHGLASITLHADTDPKNGLIANPATPNNSRMTDFMWGIATARDSNPDYF